MKTLVIAVLTACCLVTGCQKGNPANTATDRAAATSVQADSSGLVAGVTATNSAVVAPKPAQRAHAVSNNTKTPRFADMLPSERRVIDGAGISVPKVTKVIKTDDFSKFVQGLAVESAADPLAQDLTIAERSRWESQLGREARLKDFACGLSVCAGSIELGRNVALYDRISDSYLSNGTQAGSLLDYRVNRGNGNYEQRFVMSVDPAISGITFNARQPATKR